MTRLDILKSEKEQIKDMHCLAFNLVDKCIEWYDKEIEAIEVYGASNPEYDKPTTIINHGTINIW